MRTGSEIKVALVVGGHSYDVPGFRALFDRINGIDYYIQELDTWARDRRTDTASDMYDVHLFFNMHFYNSGYASVRDDSDDLIYEAVGKLGENKEGVVVLHHALLNFVEFGNIEAWDGLCNIVDRHLRGFHPNTEHHAAIVDPEHPITKGLVDWERKDETFVTNEPGPDSKLLVTTDSEQSTKTLGWVHDYKQARVFCFQPGHSNEAWVDPTFQTLLTRGIQWAARRI